MQIQCHIVSQDENVVTYQLLDSQDKELYAIEKNDIEKIYPNVEDVARHKETKIESAKVAEEPHDVIVLNDGTHLDVLLLEVADKQVKYRKINNQEGPIFVKEITNIASIIYSNGEKENFDHAVLETTEQSTVGTQIPQQSQQSLQQKMSTHYNDTIHYLALARAEIIGGVYVFTDCTPLGQYEVLGDVTFGGSNSSSFMMMPNGIGGTMMMMSGGSTPQYMSIRNGLIANAVMANRSVDGILIQIPKEGEGRATMIKFLEGEDKAKCKVNRQQGLYVFCDCRPIHDYNKLGEIVGAGGIGFFYGDLKNRLIKKVTKKYKSADGIILNLIEGNESARADAIQLQ